MLCPKCQREVKDTAVTCEFCGATLRPQPPQSANPFAEDNAYEAPLAEAVEPRAPEDDAVLAWLIPIGQSVYAVLAGYAGLISLGCCPLGPFAILFGILAIIDIKKNPGRHGIVRAILGIVLGTLSSIGLVFGLIAFLMEQT